MTFPTIVSSKTDNKGTANTSHTFTLAPTINNGNLILNIFWVDAIPTVTWDNSTAGTFTQEFDTVAFTSVRAVCYAKVADGTEDAAALSITLGSSEEYRGHSYALDNWEGTLGSGLFSATVTSSGTLTPDPPNLAPGVGSDDFMWFAIDFSDNNHSSGLTSHPTNYDDNQWSHQGTGDSIFISGSLATRNLNAASEDPGVITWANSTRNEVVATIGVRGSSSGATSSLLSQQQNNQAGF